MIELFIMIGVIGWFSRTAKARGYSGILWGIIGGASYYVPILVCGFVIFPVLLGGIFPSMDQSTYIIIATFLNLIVGICCCLLARMILLSINDKSKALSDQSLPQPVNPAVQTIPQVTSPQEQGFPRAVSTTIQAISQTSSPAGQALPRTVTATVPGPSNGNRVRTLAIIGVIVGVVCVGVAVLTLVGLKPLFQIGSLPAISQWIAGPTSTQELKQGTAAGMNLIPSDLGGIYGLTNDMNPFPAGGDANMRIFCLADNTRCITSAVFLYDSIQNDEISDMFTVFEASLKNSLPGLDLTFGAITPVALGDQAGYQEFSDLEKGYEGIILVLIRSNVMVNIKVESNSEPFSIYEVLQYAEKILQLIESPRTMVAIPTITPVSATTITSQENIYSLEGIEFATYRAPDGGYRVDLPLRGCKLLPNQAIYCLAGDDLGSIVVGDSASNRVIDDSNAETIIVEILEGLKPIGMLTTYSNLEFSGNKDGMYAYCFDFEHETEGSGTGCIGLKTSGGNFYVMEFFSFTPDRNQVLWDTAYGTFELMK